jgi:hypothetical protein
LKKDEKKRKKKKERGGGIIQIISLMFVKNLKKPSNNIVNINIAVAELKKYRLKMVKKVMVHYGLSTLKKTLTIK